MIFSQKLFQLKSYFNYWLEAMDEHSLHSPFIYGFYRDVIIKENTEAIFQGIENVRKDLLADNREIKINDLGAGSSITKSVNRRISSIAKSALTSSKDSRLYYRILDHIQAQNVLELGTSLGINTMYLASNSFVKYIYTIEGCQQTAALAKTNFSSYKTNKINLIDQPIEKALDHVFNRINSLDVILFDANHTYEATLKYYKKCKPYMHEHSILIFDDIHWSRGMTLAWEEIKKEIEVTLTIDLYDLGLVFFKKNLEKENYVLSR